MHKKKRGGYAFSADGAESWRLSLWELWPGEIAWDDGSQPSRRLEPVLQPMERGAEAVTPGGHDTRAALGPGGWRPPRAEAR